MSLFFCRFTNAKSKSMVALYRVLTIETLYYIRRDIRFFPFQSWDVCVKIEETLTDSPHALDRYVKALVGHRFSLCIGHVQNEILMHRKRKKFKDRVRTKKKKKRPPFY